MKSAPLSKHQLVRQALTKSIRLGEYKPGERLPAERDIAVMHGVSYMTARRAVTEMVEVDLLLRRPREGTFVPEQSIERLATQTVHLVCSCQDSSAIRAFVRLGAQAAAAREWRTEIIRLPHQQVRPAMRALESGDLLLVLPSGPELDGPLSDALQEAAGRAVIIGNRLDHLGVPSVVADDSQGIRLAMEHLRAHGHREIAIVSDNPAHAIDRVQFAAWKAASPADWDDARYAARTIVVATPPHQSSESHVYQAVRNYLSADGGETTALLCLTDEMALPALAACRDTGRPCPDQISLIASGDSSSLSYAYPPVTCVDIHMDKHIEQAMDILDNFVEESLDLLDSSNRLRLIQPNLVARQSVGFAV